MNMRDRARLILDDLHAAEEHLIALSDDIWINIDHNDPRALQEGVRFKQTYNEKLTAFRRLADDMDELLRSFFEQASPSTATVETTPDREVRERETRALDTQQPHSLHEDFTYKRPLGFTLEGQRVRGTTTWRQLYEQTLILLAQRDPTRYRKLPDEPQMVSRRGNPQYTREPKLLRDPMSIPHGIYAEVNMSANHICAAIREVLAYFNIPENKFIVYLREDRDA